MKTCAGFHKIRIWEHSSYVTGPGDCNKYPALILRYVYMTTNTVWARPPEKVHVFISIMPIAAINPMFEHSFELSHGDVSNNWYNIGFGEEVTQVELIEDNFTLLIWSSDEQWNICYFYWIYMYLYKKSNHAMWTTSCT